MDEKEFLGRVRRAVARTVPHFGDLLNDHVRSIQRHDAASSHGDHGGAETPPHSAGPRFLGEMLGLPAPEDQQGLIDLWVREFGKVGGRGIAADGAAEAKAAIVQVVQGVLAARGGYCMITEHPLLADWDLAGALRVADVPVEVYRSEADRSMLAGASVGVTVASAAVAETGSLVIESHTHQGRFTSLLPPVHIAVVPPGAVVPGVAGWLAGRGARYQGGEEMPSSTAFATGPSRSADIAGDLALGVHGPGEVHAVLLRR